MPQRYIRWAALETLPAAGAWSRVHAPDAFSHPIITVPVATTVPTGMGAGSLQVIAVSPARAAGLPLIITVALPIIICP